jgi:peptide/nickel transport system substrate-binding protein
MRPAKVALAAVMASALLVTAACSSDSPSSGNSGGFANGGTFTLLAADDPGSLNPFQNIQTPGVSMFKYLYSYLLSIDSSGKLVPELATSWTVDGGTVTFKLKTGVTCSDGSPVTATTIADNFNYAKDPANKAVQIGIIFPNTNFTATPDDATNTLTVKFDTPYGFVLQALSLFPIVCGAGLKDPTTLTAKSSGSGPFVLNKAVTGTEYDFDKRAGYSWGPNGATNDAPGVPDKIVEKIVGSQSTAANLLVSKSANAAQINGPDGARLTDPSFKSIDSVVGGISMLFNQSPGRPTADLAVRKALTMVLDIPQVSATVTQGISKVAGKSLTPAQTACDDTAAVSSIPTGDQAAAESLLTQAGWVAGSDGIRVKDGKQLAINASYLTTTAGDAPAMDLIEAAWKKLGAKVTLQPLDNAGVNTAMFASGNYDVMPLIELAVPFQSILIGWLSGPNPPNGINTAHISTPAYTDNANKAIQTPGDEGCALWTAAAKGLYEHADIIPISIMPARYFMQKATFDLWIGRVNPTSIRLFK